MTITDIREPVYRKKNGRYVAFASLEQGFGNFDAWCSPGVWLHTNENNSTRMHLISTLDELPCSAVRFASALRHGSELVDLLRDHRRLSTNDLSELILEWIATK
jgi:hypothetical protein